MDREAILFYGHSVLAWYPKSGCGPYPIDRYARPGMIAQEAYAAWLNPWKGSQHYRAIVVMFGINELYQGLGCQNAVYWISKAVILFRRLRLTDTILVFEAMPNFGDDPIVSLAMIERLNLSIRSMAKNLEVMLGDWSGVCRSDGSLSSEFSPDGIHLTNKGYIQLENKILTFLDNN